MQWRIPDRPVELFYEKVGDYSIDFEIRFWTDPDQKVYLTARSEAIKAIKRTFGSMGFHALPGSSAGFWNSGRKRFERATGGRKIIALSGSGGANRKRERKR